jgi:hypothetical protein
MVDDLVQVMVESGMHVPSNREGWRRMCLYVGSAVAASFSASMFSKSALIQSPLEEPIGLLVRDSDPREYDFVAHITSDGAASNSRALAHSAVALRMTVDHNPWGARISHSQPPGA